MANNIVLSSAIRSNLITLQNTAQLQAQVQERLSTGKKVNSALDNPNNFFTAAGLNRRASDLSALLDGMSQGIKTLEAADNAMKSINKTVETMQANIRQARQDKSFKGASYSIDATTIGTVSAKTLAISGGAVTGTVNVALNTTGAGSAATAATVTAGAFSAVDFENAGGNNGQISFDLALDGAAAQTITVAYADVNGVAADSGAVTAAELAGIINTKAGSTVASVSAGKLVFTSPTTGASSSVAITNFAVSNGASGSGIANASATGAAAVAAGAVKTVDQLVTAINGNSSLTGKVKASNDGGKLRIENLSTEALTVVGATSS
ncbi:MAG TPA: hypothetical protein VF744_06485, partial [Beijerinckiaceae bacterium]